ncbi:hypothetical protein R1flu_025631 [Riccia fluitans]|uniref:Uncharacterized protein n=1 Tax=Riccia fluitans TaxID=41844 RepID=A0ABD1XYB4_9MARC
MQAFLGYMGACHKRLFGETGFWSRNYKDYFNVGYALTVSLPVFSRNGSFIGVASMDAVSDELGPDEPQNVFRKEFEAAVEAHRVKQDKVLAAFDEKTFPKTEVPAIFDDSSCVYDMRPQLLCSSEQGNSKKTLDDRRCCISCRNVRSGGPDKKKAITIALPSVFGFVVLMVVIVAVSLFLCWYCSIFWWDRERVTAPESDVSNSVPGISTGGTGGAVEMPLINSKPVLRPVIPSEVRNTFLQFLGTGQRADKVQPAPNPQ